MSLASLSIGWGMNQLQEQSLDREIRIGRDHLGHSEYNVVSLLTAYFCKINLAFRVSIRLGATGVFGDDDKLRSEANELFGAIEIPRDAMIGTPNVVLGRALFWDERISSDGKTSCASCHRLKDYGADRQVVSRRATGKMTKRNSQTVFNATRQPTLRWTGNRKSGAEQAERSLTGSMGLASREAAVQLLKTLGYIDTCSVCQCCATSREQVPISTTGRGSTRGGRTSHGGRPAREST